MQGQYLSGASHLFWASQTWQIYGRSFVYLKEEEIMTTKTSIWQVDRLIDRKSTNRCSLSAKTTLFSKAELSFFFLGGFPLYLDLQVVMLTSLFVYFSTFSPWRLCTAAIVGHPAPRRLLLISNLQFTLTQMKPSGFIPWTKPMCLVGVSADALLAMCHQNQLL